MQSALPRLNSLDELRGLTMALMILVNTGGDSAHTFGFLQHSRWNGCTLAMASLSYSLLFTYACYIPMRILYVHRIFIKI